MLEAVRFKNCQSLGDCVLSFTGKLNVIVAENNTGKSVLYKVLKLAGRADYYTREERKDLIRRGASAAQITFKFDDGSYAVMQITPGKTVYAFLENAKSALSWFLEPPERMVNHLGLLVNNTEAFIANIVDMDQGLLLVNPRLKSNYELVKMIATCESLDELREKVDNLLAEFREKSMRAADSVNFVERQLSQLEYYDVESLERKYRIVVLAGEWLFNCCTVFENAVKAGSVASRYKDFNSLLKVTDVLDWLGTLVYFMAKWGVVPRYFWELESKALTVSENLQECLGRITTRCPLPEGCETLCAVEELLLSVIPIAGKAAVRQHKDWGKVLSVLESLESITGCFNLLAAGKEPVSILLADALAEAELLLGDVKSLCTAISATERDKASVDAWEERFVASGEVVKCPVWGEVVFDGKACSVKEVAGG